LVNEPEIRPQQSEKGKLLLSRTGKMKIIIAGHRLPFQLT